MDLRYRGTVMSGDRGALVITDIAPPVSQKRSSHTERLWGHGLHPSREWLDALTWTWSLGVNTGSRQEALSMADKVASAWSHYGVMRTTSQRPLEYSHDGGQTWSRVYGRPGALTSVTPGLALKHGMGVMDLEFIQTDPRHFDSLESQTTIHTHPEATGGLVAPVVAPIKVSRTGGVSERLAVNDGTVVTPVRVRFHGPISNPGLSMDGGWKLQLKTSLQWDEWIEVDAMARTVTRGRDGQTSTRPALEVVSLSSSPFRDLNLNPGSNSLRLTGVDQLGTSRVDVYWRSASLSLR